MQKICGDKTSVSGQRLRIFVVKYDFWILLRRVAIVKIQMFQCIYLTGYLYHISNNSLKLPVALLGFLTPEANHRSGHQ